ncbi:MULTISPECIES: tyrosine-type recombinase/integrase [unclassified Bradyrhizobium]|uniref:tyrosine-type recombinase/integrase n=1 Tax=Bradyrhizobium sp. USDA 4541 TaxID=2817704 RepID=UPI0020A248A3|nr:site-specific integrase [Bradyrhizobium sp. USDA 4541]MCP1852114.1 integrase [Bradyrhizobium sp. USDA 4541]
MPAKQHRKELTVTMIGKLKAPVAQPGAKHAPRLWVADSIVPGFGVRVSDKGTKTFVLRTRYPGEASASRREIGKVGEIELTVAREKARRWLGLIADGKDPARVEEEQRDAQIERDARTIDAVLDAFVKRHASKLRSADQVTHAFDTYVRPKLGSKSIYDVKRSEIVTMLDDVEDEAGPVMADRVLAHVRKAFNWQAARDDEFNSPIVRGMARTKPKERQRKRTLTDDEIRDVWAALDTTPDLPACYPRFVRSLLLCATRRNESAYMHSAEFEGDNWTIPGKRYKNKLDHVIPLTAAAKVLIGDKPEGLKGNSWFIFSTTGGKKGFSGFSKAKRTLDAQIAKARKAEGREAMPGWTLHDLRRTARSLMSRAKVPADHAERCLGHVIGGVRETYDRYEYLDEKRVAFEEIAGLVELILKPPSSNVISFQAP